MSGRRVAVIVAGVVAGVFAVASVATSAAARTTAPTVDGADPLASAAELVLIETRLLSEIGAFAGPLPDAVARVSTEWQLRAEMAADPLTSLAAVEGLAVGIAPELEASGVEVPAALEEVLSPLDDGAWAALEAGEVGVLIADDHELAIVVVLDAMDRSLPELIADLDGRAGSTTPPVPVWVPLLGLALAGGGLVLLVRALRAHRDHDADRWFRELTAVLDPATVERLAHDLVLDLAPQATVRFARPDDDDPLVASANALGSAVRRSGRLAVPAVGGGRIRRVIVLDPAPPRRRSEALHELAAAIGPAIARAEDHVLAAEVDPLTHVYNRRRLDRDLGRTDVDGTSTSLLMVDVDHFKAWNDAHGHGGGDVALQVVADAICGSVRPSDVVYRYGGEEFTVLLPGTTGAEAERIAERLRRAVAAAPVVRGGVEIGSVTVSVGVADTVGGPARTLTDRADAALYDAKRAGRDQVVVADACPAGSGRCERARGPCPG